MAAALKSSVPASTQADRRSTRLSSHTQNLAAPGRRVVPLPGAQGSNLVPLTAKPRNRILSGLHWASSLGAAIAVVMALGGYGYSVHINRQLSRSENQLAKLQRSQDQLMSVNEVLKNHMAEQVQQPSTDLRPPQLNNVIFLQPAPKANHPATSHEALKSLPRPPLSY